MLTEENATGADVEEREEMDPTGSTIGGLVHLEVGTAGVGEGGVEEAIEIALVVLVCSEQCVPRF